MWDVEFHDHRPEKEMEKQPAEIRAVFAQQVELVERYGPDAEGMPDIKSLQKGLYEFRMRDKDNRQARALFACDNQTVTILLVFTKKSQKTPQRHLNTARKRQKEI